MALNKIKISRKIAGAEGRDVRGSADRVRQDKDLKLVVSVVVDQISALSHPNKGLTQYSKVHEVFWFGSGKVE
jgi:hypothetical protein